MSGGLFGIPFVLNIKCIIFSILIMLIYTFRPPVLSLLPSLIIYFLIFVISYIFLAWYDYYYGCNQLPLFKSNSSLSITGTFKPPAYEPQKQNEHLFSQKEIEKNNTSIYALHFLIIVPILLYIGIRAQKTPRQAYYLLLVLAAFTATYHGIRLLGSVH